MRHITFAPKVGNNYDIVILIKDSYFDKDKLYEHYVKPLVDKGIKPEDIIALNLEYPSLKVTAKQAKDYLTKSIIPAIKQLGAKFVYCADSQYYKSLTGKAKSEPYLGYMVSTPQLDYVQTTYGINYSILLYNPNQSPKLDLSLNALASAYLGNYEELGENVIQSEYYPFSEQQIQTALDSLLDYPALTCDIEAFSLKLHDAGVGTITFAWDEHNGIAFAVDCVETKQGEPNSNIPNPKIKRLIKQFFEKYKGKVIYHNATYDVKVLLLNLFMEHPQDYRGMLYGLDILTRNIEDTKVIAFLALNTTADISLSLKDLSHEYTGNYAQSSINDITQIPMEDLLRYNLTDALATWFVYKKYYPQMVQDQQEDIYRRIMIPSLKILIQMEVVGMPVNPRTVGEQSKLLLDKAIDLLDQIRANPHVIGAMKLIATAELAALNAKLKTKQHPFSKVAGMVFNPGSPKHMQALLYDYLGLPVIDTTPTKEPAVGGKTLEKYLSHPLNQSIKDVIQLLMDYGKLTKITSTFIPALESAVLKQDGMAYLHANFNLNGALSGRMSCNSPNLQQIPSKGEYGKIIKKCFQAPKGWLFGSADFPSLEDRINALLTKDPNKLKVYQGFMQYEVTINGVTHVIKEIDQVSYEGEVVSGTELYAKLTSSKP